jgi:prolyl-tRNA synthetase
MRASRLLMPTVKETPADAQVASHRLMVRAGMIRKVAAGIYTYLPLGWRVFKKVESIVREEMDRAGAQELLMPAVQPSELWEQSGRWQQYGPELLRFKDRKAADFCLGPTHEEVITSLCRDEVKSYKQLPLNLYQIQTKFRDEIRPRFGLMRGREFIMKDAYSFDLDEEGANKSYDAMFGAYQRIFARCGLKFRPVEADTGAIGGNRSHEFQVLADTGEDAIVFSEEAGYAANVELAAIGKGEPPPPRPADAPAFEKVSTPATKTIDELTKFLGVEADKTIKAVMFIVDEDGDPAGDEEQRPRPVMALCRGDHDVNEVKLRRAAGGTTARLMTDDEVLKHVGGPAGYCGPVGKKDGLALIADQALEGTWGMVCGANEEGHHLVQVAWDRDYQATVADLRGAQAGDLCAHGGVYQEARGIEVGHVFFLGTKYSVAMGATVLDENGKDKPMVMGCYGIGITRTAAAAIEQNHDDDGIIWPAPIAPFEVVVVALGKEDEVKAESEKIYEDLTARGIDVLLDDRNERPGVKFKDHDLIGCPVRVQVGARGLKEGVVEVKDRNKGRDGVEKVPVAEAAERAAALISGMLQSAQQRADEAVGG